MIRLYRSTKGRTLDETFKSGEDGARSGTGRELDNLAAYGYEGIEFGGNSLGERQDEIVKATENHPVKASTICAGYPGCLLDSDPEQRELAIAGIRSLLKVGAAIGAVGLIMVPVFGAPRISDLSPYKTTTELETELLVEILKDLGGYAEEVGSIVLLEPLNRYERISSGASTTELKSASGWAAPTWRLWRTSFT